MQIRYIYDRYLSPPPLLAGTPKPGFGRKLFPKAHFEPTGLVFPEEGKKNPERGFTGGGLPPLVFRRRKEIWSGRGVQGSQAAAMPEGGKKKLPEGLGVGGGSTHMNPSGEEGKMEPRGGLGVTRREGEVMRPKITFRKNTFNKKVCFPMFSSDFHISDPKLTF